MLLELERAAWRRGFAWGCLSALVAAAALALALFRS
jgi:hypothetical protein